MDTTLTNVSACETLGGDAAHSQTPIDAWAGTAA